MEDRLRHGRRESLKGNAFLDRPPEAHPGDVLCQLDALEDPGAKAFNVVFDDGHRTQIFVVRVGAEAYAYVNICPHQFLPLNWSDDRFLGYAKDSIVCVHHGAVFEMETGELIWGPVAADCRLRPVPVAVEAGAVRLAAEGVPRF